MQYCVIRLVQMIFQGLSVLGFVGALWESPSPSVMKSVDGVKSVTFTLFTVFGARVRKFGWIRLRSLRLTL